MNPRNLIVGLLAMSMSLIGPMAAQDYRASLQGIVTDPSNAAVPGASVKLQNNSTGAVVSTGTNATGRYIFDFVEPGPYTLSVEAAGFAKFISQNITVNIRADLTVNAVLQIATSSDSVTVAAEAPAVEFNSATLSVVTDRKMIQELPVGNRNALQLALLNPSVTNANAVGTNLAEGINNVLHPMNFVFTGTRRAQLNIVVDGQSAVIGPIDANNPSKDAVQELSVQENTTDAEFGRSAGGVISVVSRTGTNEWHGNVQYTGKNPAVNAALTVIPQTANPNRDNFWGATVGNPIKKNKLFTFNSYEGRRQILPRTWLSTMPTGLERKGDFSQSLNFQGVQRLIYDPTTTVFNASNNTSTRTPFPRNIIPADRLDPTAARMMQHVWAPNNPGQNLAGLNNYAKNFGIQGKYVNFLNRTDWNVSDRLRLYGRINATQATFVQDNYCLDSVRTVNSSAASCFAMQDTSSGIAEQRGVTGDGLYTFSSTVALDLRFNWSRASSIGGSPITTIGEQGFADLWGGNNWFKPYINPTVLPTVRFPALNFSGAATLGTASYWIRRGHNIETNGKVSWVLGKHYLKAGLEYRRNWFDSFWPSEGTFTANPADTASTFLNPNTAISGDPYASFLLGVVSGNFAVATPLNLAENMLGAFIQDDLKLTRRITLNLGLRWEASLGIRDSLERLTRRVDVTTPIPALQANPIQLPSQVTAMLAAFPNSKVNPTTGGLYFTGSNPASNTSEPATLFSSGLTGFQPRLGIAIRVNDKTSVRAGYARWMLPPNMQTDIYSGTTANGALMPVYGFSAASSMLPSVNGIPKAYLNDPFPASNPLVLPTEKSLGVYTQLGGVASFIHNDYPVLTNDRVSIAVSRQLPQKVVMDLTYLFNYGRNLSGASRNLNLADPAITYQYKAQTLVAVANPFYNYLSRDQFPGNLRNQATTSVANLFRPYPQYTSLTERNTPGIENRAHSFHVTTRRPFASGVQGMFSYTYGHEVAGTYFNAPDEYADRYTLQPIADPRHRIAMALAVELPIGRGKRFLATINPVFDHIVGGWKGYANMTWNSGSFLSFGQAHVNCNPVISNPQGQHYFDTSCFERVANPTYEPRTNPILFGGLTGPPYRQLDGTVAKEFKLTEKVNMEFRFEAYNLTNSIMWSNPGTTPATATFGLINRQANIGRFCQYTGRINF